MPALLDIPAPKMPPLYAKQREAILCPSRYTLIEASSKSGKTAGCLVWLLTLAWNEGKENRSYWWVAPIAPQAKIAFRRLKRMLRQFDPAKFSWDTNETELRIDLKNGASIWFKGSDNPDTLYGEDVYGAVIDEATRCKEESFHAVRSTLTATQAPIKIIGNVRGRKNWAYKLARRAEAGEPNMSYFKLTAYDAVAGGIVEASEVEDARRTLPDRVFRELYLAEPSDDGGNPFGIAAIAACVAPLSSAQPVAFGVDLAKSVDWTVVCGVDSSGSVCRLDRWQSDWKQTRERVIAIVGDTPAMIDSTGVGDPIVEDVCRSCPAAQGFKFSANSKQQIMEGLASSIQRGAVSFPHGWLTAELEAFEFEYRAGGVRYAASEGMHDDGVCALALANHMRGETLYNVVDFDSCNYVLTGSTR
jgi:hypothetical protein